MGKIDKEKCESEDKTPIGIAVDLLFKRRDGLLDNYESRIIEMSQSYNTDRCQDLYTDLHRINNEIQFVARILALVRNEPISYGAKEIKEDV